MLFRTRMKLFLLMVLLLIGKFCSLNICPNERQQSNTSASDVRTFRPEQIILFYVRNTFFPFGSPFIFFPILWLARTRNVALVTKKNVNLVVFPCEYAVIWVSLQCCLGTVDSFFLERFFNQDNEMQLFSFWKTTKNVGFCFYFSEEKWHEMGYSCKRI